MVKVKVRYLLIEVLSNDERPLQMDQAFIAKFYVALMKEITELHGDYGNGAVRNSVLIKVADGDVALIRIESSAEIFLKSTLPLITSIGNVPVVLRTLFVGRSVRSCEKRLIKIRRDELQLLYKTAEDGVTKNAVLDALSSVSGSISIS